MKRRPILFISHKETLALSLFFNCLSQFFTTQRHINPISCSWFSLKVCLTKTMPLFFFSQDQSSEADFPAFIPFVFIFFFTFFSTGSHFPRGAPWLARATFQYSFDVASLRKNRTFVLGPLSSDSAIFLSFITTWCCCLWCRKVVAWVSTTVYTHFNLSLSLSLKFFISLNEHIFPHISAFINCVFIQYKVYISISIFPFDILTISGAWLYNLLDRRILSFSLVLFCPHFSGFIVQSTSLFMHPYLSLRLFGRWSGTTQYLWSLILLNLGPSISSRSISPWQLFFVTFVKSNQPRWCLQDIFYKECTS